MKNLFNINTSIEARERTLEIPLHTGFDQLKKGIRKIVFFMIAIVLMIVSMTSCCWGRYGYGERGHGEHHGHGGGHGDRYLNYVQPSNK